MKYRYFYPFFKLFLETYQLVSKLNEIIEDNTALELSFF